jgi:type I restriction enzyme S subunit
MKSLAFNLANLIPNLEWASLPLFDRKGWTRVRFGDVVKQIKKQVDPQADGIERYVAGEHMETEKVHIRTWGTVGDGYLGPAFIRGFRKGQVLYGSRRTYLKKVAVAEWDGVTANTTFVLETVEGRMLQELLPWLMLSERFTKHSIQESKGSTNPYINFPDIASFEFDLPPQDQQRRIAEILWAADDSLRANDRLELLLREYRQALLDSIALKYAAAHALTPLDSAIEQGRPICYGILMPGLGIENGIPVIKVRDFPDGYIREEDLLQTTPEIEASFKRSRLSSGDLIISIRGTIGRIAEVPPTLDGANITQDTARLSISPEHNRGYLRAILESRFVERQIQSRITGLAVKGINIGELRQIQIPLPSRRIQDEIAEKLSTISSTQKAVAANLVQIRNVMATNIENLLGGSSR